MRSNAHLVFEFMYKIPYRHVAKQKSRSKGFSIEIFNNAHYVHLIKDLTKNNCRQRISSYKK